MTFLSQNARFERVQRAMRGLLQFARVDSGGVGPDELSLRIQPVLDVEGFMGAASLRVASQEGTVVAGSPNGAVPLSIGITGTGISESGWAFIPLVCGCNVAGVTTQGDFFTPRVTIGQQELAEGSGNGTGRNVQLWGMGSIGGYFQYSVAASPGGSIEGGISYTFPRPIMFTRPFTVIAAIQNCLLTTNVTLKAYCWGYETRTV